MREMHKDQQGFSALGVVLIVVVLGILGFTGWFMYHSQKSTNKTLGNANKVAAGSGTAIANFDQCLKAPGSAFKQTYPATCVTKAGKAFRDSSQTSHKYLVIKEWGVVLPLSTDIADGDYAVIDTSVDPQSETVGLSTRSIAAASADCAANAMGISALIRQTVAVHDANVGKPNTMDAPHPVYPKRIGNYYYQYHQETGVAPTVEHVSGLCGDYKVGLAAAEAFKVAFDHMLPLAQ